MKARCVTCEQMVEADDETCAWFPAWREHVCECHGGSACHGDDLRADDAYNSPTRGVAEQINDETRRRR